MGVVGVTEAVGKSNATPEVGQVEPGLHGKRALKTISDRRIAACPKSRFSIAPASTTVSDRAFLRRCSKRGISKGQTATAMTIQNAKRLISRNCSSVEGSSLSSKSAITGLADQNSARKIAAKTMGMVQTDYRAHKSKPEPLPDAAQKQAPYTLDQTKRSDQPKAHQHSRERRQLGRNQP